jgi:maltose O-acetyltransferase
MAARRRARLLCADLNASRDDEPEKRAGILRELLPNAGSGLDLEPPFFCDYGTNITFGHTVFMNFNCVILDVAPVTIGSRVMFGPAVQLYAATHPLNARERSAGRELGKPITIGDDVWLGGGSIVCPGVRIGARAVIGSGSVVTKDVPEGVIAVGNPCRVVRVIPD